MSGTDTSSNNKYFCKRCKDRNWLVECKCGCGGVRPLRNKQGYVKQFLFNHHFNLKENKRDQQGFNNSMWKTGRTKKNEYWYIRMPTHIHSDKHGYVAEHVYNFTEFNQCCMLPWGIVHHKDENTENNMPWNLQGMMWGNHTQHHCKVDMSDRRCAQCGDISKSSWCYNKNSELICNKCYLKEYRKNKKLIK